LKNNEKKNVYVSVSNTAKNREKLF